MNERFRKFEQAVDVVCGECKYISEEACGRCLVHHTMDYWRDIMRPKTEPIPEYEKQIKAMKAEEFAELLLCMRTGETIDFAAECGIDYADEATAADVDCWYFATKISISEYSSNFILIDYVGGEEAFAIPLNNYQEDADDDDRRIVVDYVNRFFDKCPNILSRDSYIYVELEE